MAGPESILIPACWGLISLLLLVVAVPFFRGTGDLLTTKNLFLLGGINYVGIAGLKAAYEPDVFRVLEYDRSDYRYYVAGAFTFFAAFLLVYGILKLPRKLAGRTLRKWPSAKPSVLFFMVAASVGFALLGIFAPGIQGVAQTMAQLGNKAIVFPVALAFAAWFQARRNPVLLMTLMAVLVLSLVMAVVTGGGRRTMLGVVISIPICWYWFSLRYKSWLTNSAILGVMLVAGFLFLVAYSQVRHFDRRGDKKERSFSTAAEVLLNLRKSGWDDKAVDSMLGQNAAQTSLAAIHLYTREYDPEPFHSVFYVTSIWIPRAFWEDKPVGLGYSLPKTAKVRGTRATWGPGIVGHGFHEGGLLMLIFYGGLMGFCLRYLDELLVRQPRNAYLLATISAMSGHIFGWCRGDIGTFSVQIIGAFIMLLVFGWVGRLIFGTGLVYPKTNGPEYVNTNLFALRRRRPETASPTDFRFPRRAAAT